MRTFILAFSALLIAVVYSTHCPHGDISHCSINCTMPGFQVGCEHDICTCVASLPTCADRADCAITCKHGESVHCLDKQCVCQKN